MSHNVCYLLKARQMYVDTNLRISRLLAVQDTQQKLGVAFSCFERNNCI